MTYETCPCGASIFTLRYSRVIQWRESHRHEMPDEPEMPVIVESGSSHERSFVIGEELDLARTA